MGETAFNSGNLEGVAALCMANGCRMPPNAETARETQGILGQPRTSKEQGMAQVGLATTGAESSGDRGYGRGAYEILGAGGKPLDHAKWMNVSKKVTET